MSIIEILQDRSKLHAQHRLLSEYPWLWAVKNHWGLDFVNGTRRHAADYTPIVQIADEIVIWRLSLTELANIFRDERNSSWWTHLVAEDGDGERVNEVRYPKTLAKLRENVEREKGWRLAHLALSRAAFCTCVVCPIRGANLHELLFSDDLERLCA